MLVLDDWSPALYGGNFYSIVTFRALAAIRPEDREREQEPFVGRIALPHDVAIPHGSPVQKKRFELLSMLIEIIQQRLC